LQPLIDSTEQIVTYNTEKESHQVILTTLLDESLEVLFTLVNWSSVTNSKNMAKGKSQTNREILNN
jgi:hypothetical protein